MAKKELVKKVETQNLPTLQCSSLNNAMAIATEMSKSDIFPKEFLELVHLITSFLP